MPRNFVKMARKCQGIFFMWNECCWKFFQHSFNFSYTKQFYHISCFIKSRKKSGNFKKPKFCSPCFMYFFKFWFPFIKNGFICSVRKFRIIHRGMPEYTPFGYKFENFWHWKYLRTTVSDDSLDVIFGILLNSSERFWIRLPLRVLRNSAGTSTSGRQRPSLHC